MEYVIIFAKSVLWDNWSVKLLLRGDFMKILFSKQGKSCYVVDKERVIFCIDNAYFDINGNEVPDEEAFHKNRNKDDPCSVQATSG